MNPEKLKTLTNAHVLYEALSAAYEEGSDYGQGRTAFTKTNEVRVENARNELFRRFVEEQR